MSLPPSNAVLGGRQLGGVATRYEEPRGAAAARDQHLARHRRGATSPARPGSTPSRHYLVARHLGFVVGEFGGEAWGAQFEAAGVLEAFDDPG